MALFSFNKHGTKSICFHIPVSKDLFLFNIYSEIFSELKLPAVSFNFEFLSERYVVFYGIKVLFLQFNFSIERVNNGFENYCWVCEGHLIKEKDGV